MSDIEKIAPPPVLTHFHAFGLDEMPPRAIDVTAEVARLGVDFALAVPKHLTLYQALNHYVHEHCTQNTTNARRASLAAFEWVDALNPLLPVHEITRAHGRMVIEHLQARGLKPGSVKRIMAVGIAALHHAKREGRLTEIPKFPKVAGGQPRIRWLSRDEHRRLMQAPMSRRLRDFYILAFATGSRSEAIEQLTVTRVDFLAGSIDYRLPGKDHKNKRRAVVPISEALRPRLERMCAGKAPNDPVIGYGKRGRITTLYHESKRVLRSIGIDEYGVARHVARHTVASWLLQGDPERGIPPTPIHLVAALLGDTVMMIEKVYGHIQPKHVAGAVNALL